MHVKIIRLLTADEDNQEGETIFSVASQKIYEI
jgi:hypothetical protein